MNERTNPVCGIVGDFGDELIGVGFSAEVETIAIFKDSIHQADVHQKPFSLCTRISYLSFEIPSIFNDRDVGSLLLPRCNHLLLM